MATDETCTCGHRWTEHADRDNGYGDTLRCEGRCTVCTCNRFDWDLDAPLSAPATPTQPEAAGK